MVRVRILNNFYLIFVVEKSKKQKEAVAGPFFKLPNLFPAGKWWNAYRRWFNKIRIWFVDDNFNSIVDLPFIFAPEKIKKLKMRSKIQVEYSFLNTKISCLKC